MRRDSPDHRRPRDGAIALDTEPSPSRRAVAPGKRPATASLPVPATVQRQRAPSADLTPDGPRLTEPAWTGAAFRPDLHGPPRTTTAAVQREADTDVVQRQRFREKIVTPTARYRLALATQAIKAVNQDLLRFGAGNQRQDVERSRGASLNLTKLMQLNATGPNMRRDVVKDDEQPGSGIPNISKMATFAGHYGAGVCDNYSQVTFNWLRENAGGEKLTRCSTPGLHHAYVIIGDLENDAETDLVVADPWPTSPQACLWVDFFGYTDDLDSLNVKGDVDADGVDGTQEYAPDLTLNTIPKASKLTVKKDRKLRSMLADQAETDLWNHQHSVVGDGDPEANDYDDRPIFYALDSWDDDTRKRQKDRFERDLAEMQHLQPDALDLLGLL